MCVGLRVQVHVSLCACVSVFVSRHVDVCIFVHVSLSMYAYVPVCLCACLCVHECVRVFVCVCTSVNVACACVCFGRKLSGGSGWLGCERPESRSSLIMPDRWIRGESCCVSIATDRASVSPLNLSHLTGRKGMQAARRRGWAWRASGRSARRPQEQQRHG